MSRRSTAAARRARLGAVADVAGADTASGVGESVPQRVDDAGPIDAGVEAGPIVDTAGPVGVLPHEAPLADGLAAAYAPPDAALLGEPTLPAIIVRGAGPVVETQGPPLILPHELPALPPDALPGKDPLLEADVTRSEGAFAGVPPLGAEPADPSHGYIHPVDRVPAPGSVRITCGRAGHERGGVLHPVVAVYAPGTFTAAQLGAFEADPLLTVVPLSGAPVARAHRL